MANELKKRLPIIVVVVIFVVLIGVFVWKSNIREDEFDWSSYDNLNLSETEKIKYEETVKKVETDKKDVESLLNLARLRNWGGDPEGAITLYEEVLKERPEDILILNNLADIYYTIGDYEKSEKMYLKIIEINPKWTSAYRELVNIYHFKLKDKYLTVPDLLQGGLDVNSSDPSAQEDFYALLAIYYEDIGDTQKAMEYYEKVLEVNPDNAGASSALTELRGIYF